MARQLELDTTILGSMGEDPDPQDLSNYTDMEIEVMFEKAFSVHPESEFLESIYDQWNETSKLTEKQWQGLQNTIDRIIEDLTGHASFDRKWKGY